MDIKTKHIKHLKESIKIVSKHKKELESLLVGKLIRVEGEGGDIANALDDYGGVDYLLLRNHQVYGVALRTQSGIDYRSFTIRKSRYSNTDTELGKRLTRDKKAIVASIIVQIFVDDNNELLSIGIADYDDIVNFAAAGFGIDKVNREDGNIFSIVFWNNFNGSLKCIIQEVPQIKIKTF